MSLPGPDAVGRLARRDPQRTEADLQADIYLLLTAGGVNLPIDEVVRLEVQTRDGTRRRLDVEIGHCVIEVKKDLSNANLRADAEQQLGGYVNHQGTKTGTRYVGILTDGTTWALYHEVDGELLLVTELLVHGAQDHERLVSWLEAILATREGIAPTPTEIEQRLGAESPAHLLDHESVKALWETGKTHPEVALKRDLWAKLLRTAFGTAFADDDDLFVDHTLLVLTAETIAHAIIGYDVSTAGNVGPAAIAQGTAFSSAQIYGAVEADFFDWVVQVPGGEEFVRSLADRISRFTWEEVEHDVLKILYESIISASTRATLGEYYTPDWLAERMVADAVQDPLNQTVLDPSCGSGTFVFHAIRNYLAAADAAGIANGQALDGLTTRVLGMDVHPVAVTLARVTYLLAIGRERISATDRGPLAVPVYLGDSLQWEQNRSMLDSGNEVVIATSGDDLVAGGGGLLFGDDLVFPASVLNDARDFDRLISAMADKATDTTDRKNDVLINPILKRFGIAGADAVTLSATFDTMRRLHESGRDHIWGYYVRNLIRPIWLADDDHKVDVLVGNPPWLRYSKMLKSMQTRYKDLSRTLGLLAGPLGASGRDLSTLFVARASQLYLKKGGRFEFVMPHGTLTRKPHEPFRSGHWASSDGGVEVTFDKSWDLQDASTGFPMVSCVIRGNIGPKRTLSPDVEAWILKLPKANVTWSVAEPKLTIESRTLRVLEDEGLADVSIYKKRFRQGAVFVPRVLVMVEETDPGPLGAGAGRVSVQSQRSTQEKLPWKLLDSLSGTVERAFVRPVHLGETIAPYLALPTRRAVVPISDTDVLSAAAISGNPGLDEWWQHAEGLWEEHKSKGDSGTFLERIDFFGQLSGQLPAVRHRVVYTKAGNSLSSARVSDVNVVIDHKLYWCATSSVAESRYLVAILNSETLLRRVRPFQNLGLFGPRDFDKNVWMVPVPPYDPRNADHIAVASLSAEAEAIAERVDLSAATSFQAKRKLVRKELDACGQAAKIEAAVDLVIPPTES